MSHRLHDYDPKKYWEERARKTSDVYQAVCAYGKSYIENMVMDSTQKKAFSKMIKNINLSGEKAFELGCGVGRWIPFILSRGAKYVGVDISEEMVRKAKRRFPEAECHVVNGARLPFPDNTFKLSFSITVLHHNDYDVQDLLIDELIRITAPNGYLFLLEAVTVGERKRTYFNTFARPIEDWIQSVTRQGRAEVVKTVRLRYWILRDAARKALRAVGLALPSSLESLLLRLDLHLDYHLSRLLPKRKTEAAAMLFRKTGK